MFASWALLRAAIQELRRAQPDLSLAWMTNQMPLREDERERYLGALRRAGLD
jgi:hypothetical protein